MKDPGNDWFVGFFREYRHELRRYLARFVSSTDIAEDLTQEAFARVYAVSASKLQSPRNFLFRTGHNLALDHMRHLKVSAAEPIETDVIGIESQDPSAEQQLASKQELELVWAAIGELPPKCRKVFLLLRFEGRSVKEVAQEMELSESTVRNHAVRAFAYCQARLDEGTQAAAPGKLKVRNTKSETVVESGRSAVSYINKA